MNYGIIIILVFITFILASGLKVLAGQDRFTVFKLGIFEKLIGPGMVFRFYGKEVQWLKLRLGDRGELFSSEIARFHDRDLPISIDSDAELGCIVRITEFKEDRLIVKRDPDQRKRFRCQKYGYENTL